MVARENSQQQEMPADMDARVRALEQYLAAQSSPSASGSSHWRSIDFAGDTVIHVHGIGSFELPSPGEIRAGLVGALITLAVVLLVYACSRRSQRS